MAAALAGAGCNQPSESATDPRPPAGSATASTGVTQVLRTSTPASPSSSSPEVAPSARAVGQRRTSCQAPSLDGDTAADARAASALDACRFRATGQERVAKECGRRGLQVPLDVARLDAAVLDFDEATRAHVAELVARGRERGASSRRFALVGDSMTLSEHFMTPFSRGRAPRYAPEVAAALALSGEKAGQSIVDWFLAGESRSGRAARDPFSAARAAKSGARANWPLVGDARVPPPLEGTLELLQPAIAVVLFGTNDASYRAAPPEEIAAALTADLEKLIDALERRGVVPVLSTLPRHGRTPAMPACGTSHAHPSNWRLLVQTNAASAAVAKLACQRHLPLVDLRHALDPLPNHGLGGDGIHPTFYVGGAGVLTRQGLSCGYNVRNYLTLQMLKQLEETFF